MLAYYLHDLSPFIFELRQGFGLRWYGFAYVVSFLLGFWLYRRLSILRLNPIPPDQVADFITLCAIFGVMLGGRLGWAIFYGWRDVLANPLRIFILWEGGMASHGGILGLVIFTFWYARRHRYSWTGIGDSLVAVAPVGLFVVRCANFINGELYGKAANVPWAVQFPGELSAEGRPCPPLALIQHDPEVRAQLRESLTPRHPSQIYEALLEGAFLFAVLWTLRTRFRLPRGVITGCFFILYAIVRIIGEVYREPDPAWSVGSISAGQFLSLFLPLLGIGFIVWGLKAQQYEAALLDPEQTSPDGVEERRPHADR